MKALPRVRTRTGSSNFHWVKISELQFKNEENINANYLSSSEKKGSNGLMEITKSKLLI
jgi:hypothetical protein